MSKHILHPHQKLAIDMLRESLARIECGGRGRKRVILGAPTAFGKTVVVTEIIASARAKGTRVMVTVPRKELIGQTAKMFWDNGVREIGIMQADHPLTNPNMPVQIATVQTLAKRKVPDVGLVLVDECHMRSAVLERLMADPAWAHVPFIGLSATPWTKGLGKHYEELLIAATTQELIDRGFLSPFRVFAPPSGVKPNLSGIRTVNTTHGVDYQEDALSTEMQKPPLVADAVTTWQQLGRGRPTLVFAVDCAHAKSLHDRFCAAGVLAAYIDGDTPIEEREQIKNQMAKGQIEVCVNIGCLTTGCDWPFVSCIQLCRPTRSEILLVQIIGRGLRLSPETAKQELLVLDHTATTERLGFVTDIHHTELDDGKANAAAARKAEAALPKECTKCHVMKPARTPICPNCGHVAEVVSKVKTVDGSLHELTASGKSKARKATMGEKQLWWSAFLGYAAERGKSRSWSLAQYKTRFGVWPNQLLDEPSEPTLEMRGWIKSQQIRWAKSRANQTRAAA